MGRLAPTTRPGAGSGAERARKAAKAGRPAWHPSLRAPVAPVPVMQAPPAPPRSRPVPVPVPVPQPAVRRPAPVPVSAPCQVCGRAGRGWRLRGCTATGRLAAETAAMCGHCRGVVWAAWRGQYGRCPRSRQPDCLRRGDDHGLVGPKASFGSASCWLCRRSSHFWTVDRRTGRASR